MTDKPILFSGPMIRALLDGRKSQTRRILKPQPFGNVEGFQKVFADPPYFEALDSDGKPVPGGFQDGPNFLTPYPKIKYAVGDRLWVREAWRTADAYDDLPPRDLSGESAIWYEADGKIETCGWTETGPAGRYRHARFMPRWASRLTLIVTDVRVQRLREISEADAMAEGCKPHLMGSDRSPMDSFRLGFSDLWNSIYGPDAWDANPWVAAYTFAVHHCNIDRMDG